MLVCPRWEKVRRIGPGGVGPPLLLNRFRGYHVFPCAPLEYVHRVSFLGKDWAEPEHMNVPMLDAGRDDGWATELFAPFGLTRPLRSISGGAGWLASQQLPGRVLFGDPEIVNATSATNITISTTAIGVGARALFPNALTLANFYFFVVTSPTNNTLQYNVGAGSNSLPTTPATPTLLGPTNVTTAAGWVNISGLSAAFAANTWYWAWLSDSAAPQATNGAVRRGQTGGNLASSLSGPSDAFRGASTATDYWATAGNRALGTGDATIVFVFSGAGSFGSPFTALATSAADTNEKGLRLSGLTAPLKLYAAYQGSTPSNNLTGLNVYSGTTAPSGTGDIARTTIAVDDAVSLLHSGFLFATPPTLDAATIYHITHTFSASSANSVRRWQIGTGADANLKAAMLGGGNWYYARANGTTDFANDATDEWPRMLLEIEDLVAAAGGGGMLVHPGTVGGLRG